MSRISPQEARLGSAASPAFALVDRLRRCLAAGDLNRVDACVFLGSVLTNVLPLDELEPDEAGMLIGKFLESILPKGRGFSLVLTTACGPGEESRMLHLTTIGREAAIEVMRKLHGLLVQQRAPGESAPQHCVNWDLLSAEETHASLRAAPVTYGPWIAYQGTSEIGSGVPKPYDPQMPELSPRRALRREASKSEEGEHEADVWVMEIEPDKWITYAHVAGSMAGRVMPPLASESAACGLVDQILARSGARLVDRIVESTQEKRSSNPEAN